MENQTTHYRIPKDFYEPVKKNHHIKGRDSSYLKLKIAFRKPIK